MRRVTITLWGYANTDEVVCHTIKRIGKTAFCMGRGAGGAPRDFSPCEADGRGGSASWIRLVHCIAKPFVRDPQRSVDDRYNLESEYSSEDKNKSMSPEEWG